MGELLMSKYSSKTDGQSSIDNAIVDALSQKLQAENIHLNAEDKKKIIEYLEPYAIPESEVQQAAENLKRSIASHARDGNVSVDRDVADAVKGNLYGNFGRSYLRDNPKESIEETVMRTVSQNLALPEHDDAALRQMFNAPFALKAYKLVGKDEEEVQAFAGRLSESLQTLIPEKTFLSMKTGRLNIPEIRSRESGSFGNLCLTAIECAVAESPKEQIAAITAYNVSKTNVRVNLSMVSGDKFRRNLEHALEPYEAQLNTQAGNLDAQRSMAKRLAKIDVVIPSKDNPTLDQGMLDREMPKFIREVDKKHPVPSKLKVLVETASANPSFSEPNVPPPAPGRKLQDLSEAFLKESPRNLGLEEASLKEGGASEKESHVQSFVRRGGSFPSAGAGQAEKLIQRDADRAVSSGKGGMAAPG